MKIINNAIFICFLSILLFLFNFQFANSIEYKNMKPTIKFITKITNIKEYKLANGLKVLLKQNDSIPLVTFSIWYKVGSRNEVDGIRGLAHFLEHMMFKGTKKFKKGEISETIQNLGGVFNAFTSQDGTAYYETISPEYLEKVIQIESDRMKGSLLREEELNLERTVVLSELEGGLNDPATLLNQELRYETYEKNPYKYPIIGYEKDIKNIDSRIMRDFYKKFYNPNNATIILVGDFKEISALKLIEKYFGEIKNNSPSSSTIIPSDKEQNTEKRIKVKRSGSYKLLQIAYHITNGSHKDIYPLNIIEEILIGGKKSCLNKALIEKGLVTDIAGGAEVYRDPGLFSILLSLTPKATHKQVEKIILNELDKLIKDPPSEEEITAAKNRIRATYLFSLDGTYNGVVNLGSFELISDWKQALEWTDKISKVTEKEIASTLKHYFTKENRTIGYFIPIIRKGEKYITQPLNITTTQHYQNVEPGTKNREMLQKPGLPTATFNSTSFKYKKIKLKDGSVLIVSKNIDLPISYITGVIKGGSSSVPKKYDWECQIITRTIEKGSKNHTKEEIEHFLDNTGSQIEFACDTESVKFSLSSLNEKLDETVNFLLDLLMNPTFPEEEISKEKNKLIAEIIESKDSTYEIASRKLSQIIYPKDHPYYTHSFEEDISNIKKVDVKKLHKIHNEIVKKNKSIISLVSNLNDKELNQIINRLENVLNNGTTKEDGNINIPNTIIREVPETESLYVKDKSQSDVFLGHAGNIKRTDPDFYKINIANYILGGSPLSSHLAKRVRDNSGLVYHVHSYINATLGKGEFGIYFGSNNSNVDKAIELIRDEINSFIKTGVSEEELQKAKKSLIDSFISRNLSNYKAICNTLAGIEYFNLGENYISNYPKIINSLKRNEINEAIKKYIFPDKLNISIAGEYKKESGNQ